MRRWGNRHIHDLFETREKWHPTCDNIPPYRHFGGSSSPNKPVPAQKNQQPPETMLHWTLVFLVIAIIAAVLGFGGLAGTAAGIAKILFLIFLIVWIVSLVTRK